MASDNLPPLHAGPHQVPIAVAGSASATNRVRTHLEQAWPDAFQLTEVADARQARERVLDRDAYGRLGRSAC
jgi:hypothetical protein